MNKVDKRIPVTILTGFLGAGKTTLLNHLTQQNPNKKIAIIENEFGEIGIDNDLVIKPENGIVELSNGCICCTLNDELVEALERLLGSEYNFDHLLIETTGIAQPDAVAEAFMATPEIQKQFRVAAVVCVADAHFVVDIAQEREEARQQITFSDFILVNKASEVSSAHLHDVRVLLQKMNPLAKVETADYCKTSTNLLDFDAYNVDNLEKQIVRQTSPKPAKHSHQHAHSHEHKHEHHAHDHTCDEHCDHSHEHKHEHHPHDHTCDEHCDHSHEHKHEHHAHDHHPHECDEHCNHEHIHTDIQSESFVFDLPFDLLRFRQWIEVVLLIQKQHIYRIKGIINFAWEDNKMVFQSVQQLFQFQVGDEWQPKERRQTRIVFIGKNLNRPVLHKSLERCLYNPDEFGY